jgi:hypothetical protein
MGKQNLLWKYRTILDYRGHWLGISFYLRDSLTRELLLGLLGWREKRGSVSHLSESPLGQPLVPGSDLDRGLTLGLSDPAILSLQRKQGDGVIRVKGKN